MAIPGCRRLIGSDHGPWHSTSDVLVLTLLVSATQPTLQRQNCQVSFRSEKFTPSLHPLRSDSWAYGSNLFLASTSRMSANALAFDRVKASLGELCFA
ncbi:hypothetical protein BDW75DRAFT_57903 [Aspergillus navahoensis]